MPGDGSNNSALVAISFVGASALALTLVASPFLLVPASRRLGAIPWMATPPQVVARAVQLAGGANNSPATPKTLPRRLLRMVDLGSGDGRLVIAFAKDDAFVQCVGIELNPVLLAMSYMQAFRAGVLHKVSFRMVNFWNFDLTPFDAVCCFGVKPVMAMLEEKVRVQGKDGCKVVCFRFPLTNKKPDFQEDELYVYTHTHVQAT